MNPNTYPNDRQYSHEWKQVYGYYAGGDDLLLMVERGWQISAVQSKQYYLGTSRTNFLHCFTLEMEGEVMRMDIVSNPFIDQVAARYTANLEDIFRRTNSIPGVRNLQ